MKKLLLSLSIVVALVSCSETKREEPVTCRAVCALYLAHLKTGGTFEGAMEMIKNFDQFEQREKLFNPDSKN
jgi:hypothetical protein